MTAILVRVNLDTDTFKMKIMLGYREKIAIYKPRRQAWSRSYPHDPPKELTLPIP